MKKRPALFPHLKKRSAKTASFGEAFDALLLALGGEQQTMLIKLWENWQIIIGHELASLGSPLGHKDKTLLIGAEDSMAMQDLSLRKHEIIERANMFMGGNFFTGVRTVLLQGRRDLTRKRQGSSYTPIRKKHLPPPPEGLGKLSESMDPASPVAQCYQAYLSMYGIKVGKVPS